MNYSFGVFFKEPKVCQNSIHLTPFLNASMFIVSLNHLFDCGVHTNFAVCTNIIQSSSKYLQIKMTRFTLKKEQNAGK